MTTTRITLKEACQILRMSKRTLYTRAGHDNTFPVMIRLPNGGGIQFERAEIEAWDRANPMTA